MHSSDITSKIIPISDLRRRFGEIEKLLGRVDELILTKKGRPFAILRAHEEVKREFIKASAGVLKGTGWGNRKSKTWREILNRRPTSKPPVELT